MKENYAQYLLEQNKENYNRIADDYTRTRAFVPDDLKYLASLAKKGERILDLGCANGRFYEALENKNIDFYGVDFSEKLIEIAKRKYPKQKFFIADALNLPFPENFFDTVYSISVLHNIPSQKLRLQYLKEAKRVLKPNGFLILRVWDLWQRKQALKLFLKYTFLKFVGKTKLDFKDVFVPWKNSKGKIIIERYFHCFTRKELANLIKKAGFKMKRSWCAGKDPRTNIYIVAEK